MRHLEGRIGTSAGTPTRMAQTPVFQPLRLCLVAAWSGGAMAQTGAQSIPFDRLGAEVQKQGGDEGTFIAPTATGARVRACMQDLEGEVTAEGLWLTST